MAAVQEGPVLAASSQYFERTFNRLVVPPQLEPVIPVAPPPPVLVQPTPSAAVPVLPIEPTVNAPIQPNVAIAIATAHAAAPVATILLPPYPFGPPPTIGFIPPNPPINVPDEDRKESTTQLTTKEVKTTPREPESTTPLPSNSDNNFVQALPSNQNVNFKQYYAPPLPLEPPKPKPQKLKTSVEIVPVPLQYISPPPLVQHAPIKAIKHVHTYVPTKIIIRPISSHRIRTVRRPVRLVKYRIPLTARIGSPGAPQNVRRPIVRDIEPTTLRPFIRPTTRPPRV